MGGSPLGDNDGNERDGLVLTDLLLRLDDRDLVLQLGLEGLGDVVRISDVANDARGLDAGHLILL